MPFIDTKLNIRLSREKELVLKEKLGRAIERFPGKTEYWLMLNFSDESRMYFRGYDNFPMAWIEVKLLGGAEAGICEQMTKTLCELFKAELGISPEHIYVKYEFCDTWGWNNENF